MTTALPDPTSLRHLAVGDVVGTRIHDGTLHAWRGLPYAAPPVGPLRWRAPQPMLPWHGVKAALSHPAMAPQIAGLLAPLPKPLWGTVVGDEDCLGLNIFAPAWAPGDVPLGAGRRPVMLWIHGGGNAVGTSATYDVAANHAAHNGFVVVTVNYRLGMLGWFNHPALHVADTATPEECSGNFGLLDLIAALRWVRRHISAFGGDPANVTVFGESAGGQQVLMLLASPLAAGLFHRAIAQSPVTQTFSVEEATEPPHPVLESERLGSAEVVRRLWLAAPGHADATQRARLATLSPQSIADFLRALPPARLLAAFPPGTAGIALAPRPIRDGVVLPAAPLPEVFASGRWNRMPVILGSNRDEYRTFLADKPEHTRLLFGRLPLLRDRTAYAAEADGFAAAWRAVHVDAPADAMLAGGHTDVWTYRFDWDEAPAVPFVRPDLLLGAAHGMEMPFAFRDTRGVFDLFGINTRFNRASRVALAEAIGDAWASFARDGKPSLPGQGSWPRRTLAAAAADSLLFDSARGGGLRMARLRDALAGIEQRLMTDTRLSPALRCRIHARVFHWSPLFRIPDSAQVHARWCAQLGCPVALEAHRPRVEI